MRSALIIGAGGQDGRLLTSLLLDREYSVRGWVRKELDTPALCECMPVDLLTPTSVENEVARLQPDEIYYLAAFHHATEEAVEESAPAMLQRSFAVHVFGLVNVLEAIKTHCRRARLFYAASSHVFGKPTTEWQDEGTLFMPQSAYGISKAAGIQCCQLYRQQEEVFAATGILFNHESALRKQTFLSQKIVQGALRACREPNYKLKLGDLDTRIDWGYAPDYVDAMYRILQLPAASDFVVASGEMHSVREFVEIAFGALDLDWRRCVEIDTSLLQRTSYPLRGNAGKLRAATGWNPTTTFTKLVTRLVHDAERTYETV
ncbi:MAG: GDPmannose 4,6-dehydratase [Verrucomicrobiota bacterium]